jgi:hypothetical protein
MAAARGEPLSSGCERRRRRRRRRRRGSAAAPGEEAGTTTTRHRRPAPGSRRPAPRGRHPIASLAGGGLDLSWDAREAESPSRGPALVPTCPGIKVLTHSLLNDHPVGQGSTSDRMRSPFVVTAESVWNSECQIETRPLRFGVTRKA